MDLPMTISIEAVRPDTVTEPAPAGPPPLPVLGRIAGVGTAVPETSYTQQELLDTFEITDPKIRSVFLNSAIDRRCLTLPPRLLDGTHAMEEQGELLDKHKAQAVEMGARALLACLDDIGATLEDI